ncbi:hypothetical protein C7967_1061, partial [Thalassospira sp. 11-3]
MWGSVDGAGETEPVARWTPETHTTSATSVIVGVAMGQEYRQLGLDERIE